jgi:hypothetical protein
MTKLHAVIGQSLLGPKPLGRHGHPAGLCPAVDHCRDRRLSAVKKDASRQKPAAHWLVISMFQAPSVYIVVALGVLRLETADVEMRCVSYAKTKPFLLSFKQPIAEFAIQVFHHFHYLPVNFICAVVR